MGQDLRSFLEQVKAVHQEGGFREAGYVDVQRPLSPHLEVQIIQQKLAGEGRYPVIYCHQIEGSDMPLVTNLLGSFELQGLALGFDPLMPRREMFWAYRGLEANPKPTKAVAASKAPVRQVILKGKEIDLNLLPIPQHAMPQAGKYITIGCMLCKDPDTGIPNLGIYRHQVKGKDQLGCMINPTNHAGYIAHRYAKLGKPMEVAIVIGHHPALAIASCARGSVDMDEMEIAGGLLRESLEVVKAETVDLEVPAMAEIVIEGVIDDPRPTSTDGPFPEAIYYGRGGKPCYLIQVTAITMRRDAIYHDLDPCHREHGMTGSLPGQNRIFNAVREVVPTVKEVRMDTYFCYVCIEKRIEGEGKKAAMAALSASFNAQFTIAVDDDIDIYDERQVKLAMGSRLHADRAIEIIPRVTGWHLNPASYNENRDPVMEAGPMTTQVIIDATKPLHQSWSTMISRENAYGEHWSGVRLEDYLGQRVPAPAAASLRGREEW